MDLDMPLRDSDMVMAIFVHLDTATRAETLDKGIANFGFKQIGGVFINVKIDIALE